MEGQVDALVAARRSAQAQELSQRMRLAEARALVGSEDLVVVQAPGAGITGGLFDARLDETIPVDSLVRVQVASVDESATLTCVIPPQ